MDRYQNNFSYLCGAEIFSYNFYQKWIFWIIHPNFSTEAEIFVVKAKIIDQNLRLIPEKIRLACLRAWALFPALPTLNPLLEILFIQNAGPGQCFFCSPFDSFFTRFFTILSPNFHNFKSENGKNTIFGLKFHNVEKIVKFFTIFRFKNTLVLGV